MNSEFKFQCLPGKVDEQRHAETQADCKPERGRDLQEKWAEDVVRPATSNERLPYGRLWGIPRHYARMQDICPSTSQNAHIYIKTLHTACLMLGGEHRLAAYLGVSTEEVEAWLNGRGAPSDAVFLRCVDLVESRRKR